MLRAHLTISECEEVWAPIPQRSTRADALANPTTWIPADEGEHQGLKREHCYIAYRVVVRVIVGTTVYEWEYVVSDLHELARLLGRLDHPAHRTYQRRAHTGPPQATSASTLPPPIPGPTTPQRKEPV